MIHTVDFPTRLQNGHSSATDNIFLDKSRSQSYKIIPLTNALSDHEAQCIILNKFFTDSKHKYTRRVRLIVRESVNCFCEQLLQESWNDVFSTNDVNNSFKKFLNIILTIHEASFPYKYPSKDQDKGWITQGIRKSCQRKRSLYTISKNNDNLDKTVLQKLLLYFKDSN